ncbi:MAG: DUF4340 domain-containing protein [Saprospiraceae bacterium]
MKKTLILLIAFALLGSFTTWYVLSKPDDKTTLLAEERRFKVENTDEIYKIFIADRRGNQTTLERKDGYWLYNGKYPARPNAVENVLDAVRRIEIQYKPPTAAVNNIIKNLSTQGIKIQTFNRNNQLLQAYYIGGGTADETGTYAIKEGAEQPYVVSIPGWQGNIRFRFNLIGDDWRDKTVFAEKAENIESVSVEYPKNRNKSFKLERAGNTYRITPFYDITPIINRPYKEGSVERYLEGFRNLGAEAFENENPRRDSVRQLLPFGIITLKNKAGAEKTVRLFPIFTANNQAERYFIDVNNEDFMLGQHLVLSKILWGYDFFFENP